VAAAATAGLALGAVAPAANASTPSPAFYPISVTFVSLNSGWALGATPCGGRTCLALEQTSDGGRSWARQALPKSVTNPADIRIFPGYVAGGLLNIRFANSEDGWIFGAVLVQTAQGMTSRSAIWSTENRGHTWQTVAPPSFSPAQGSVLDLEASAGTAYLLLLNGDQVELESSPVDRENWSIVPGLHFGLPAGGANLTGSIILDGLAGWLVEGNDRGTTGAARMVDGHWENWVPPCANVGGTETFPAAPTVTDLYAVCIMGGFGSIPLNAFAPPGAVEGSAWLYASTNGGYSFQPVRQLSRQGYSFGDTGALASPAPGVIFDSEQGAGASDLVASFDGGAQWSSLYRASSIAYVGFTSPSQGVAIVQVTGGGLDNTAMIMTYDGGHQWHKVSF